MKREPVSKRAIWQVVSFLLVVAFFTVLVVWLQRSAPTAPPPPFDLSDETSDTEFVSCERTLPEQDVAAEVSEEVRGPVGRVSSAEVLQCPRRFDGRLVTYIGEAVGDILLRDGGAWVQVNDDDYALSHGPLPSHREHSGTNSGLAVWVPDELVDRIQTPGRRGLRGDIVEVEGILHRADPADGGGLTVRARSVRLLVASAPLDQPVHRRQAIAAAVLALVALALVARERAMDRN